MGKYSKYVKREHLRKVRRKKNISADEIARKLDFSSTVSYYNLENGITEPKISYMVKIAKMLGEPVTNFFIL